MAESTKILLVSLQSRFGRCCCYGKVLKRQIQWLGEIHTIYSEIYNTEVCILLHSAEKN